MICPYFVERVLVRRAAPDLELSAVVREKGGRVEIWLEGQTWPITADEADAFAMALKTAAQASRGEL